MIKDRGTLTVLAIAILLGATVLLAGAFYYPFISSDFQVDFPDWIPNLFGLHNELEQWIIKKGKIPTGDQYLLGIIKSLFEDDNIFLGVLILLFSVFFPALKIILCSLAMLPYNRSSPTFHNRVVKSLGYVSKWSMADVFIVAFIIVMFKAKGFNFTFRAEPGIYCYGVSAILSSIAIVLVMQRTETNNLSNSP